MSLGKKLSGYRRDAGYTQQQLGDLLNVSAQAVSKWENDQAEPDLQMLRRLCLIYKIKMDDLFDEESASAESAPQAESAAPAGRAGSAERKDKLVGYCVNCGSVVYKGNEVRTPSGLYCKMCYGEQNRKIRRTGVNEVQKYSNRQPYDDSGGGWGVLAFFFPVVGLILSIIWKSEYPKRADACFGGFILFVVFAVIACILLAALVRCSGL